MSGKPAGRFITLEGGEGAGKSTQVARLAARLRAAGQSVLTTREPGGSALAERIRDLIFAPANHADALTELLLFSAARADHLVCTIRPALAAGTWVICDRFADSTRAYQGVAGALPDAVVTGIERHVVGSTVPDLTLILDLDPVIGAARVAGRAAGNSFDARNAAFHDNVRAAFLAIARAEPIRCVLVDASLDADAVAAQIDTAVRLRLGNGPAS